MGEYNTPGGFWDKQPARECGHESLLPCPFDGGTAKGRWTGGVYVIECESCGCSQGDDGAESEQELAAAARWNRRVAPETVCKPGEFLCERLRDCESSLGIFDPGAAFEYWLKYAGTAQPSERSAQKAEAPRETASPRYYRLQSKSDPNRFFDYDSTLWELVVPASQTKTNREPECPKCKTLLAFEEDVCWACSKEER